MPCEAKGVRGAEAFDFLQHGEVAVDGDQEMERAVLHDRGVQGIACSQTVMSFEKLARLQDIVSSDRENLAHQIAGSANRDDCVFDAQASSAYVEDLLQYLGIGHRLESAVANGLQEIPARLSVRTFPAHRVEKDVGVKEDAGHDDPLSPS